MPRKEPSSGSETSEDEFEVEYVYQARWTGSGWEYEVHWYGYDTDNDTWEPEDHLTNFGSADLVNRFWKQFPGQRHAKQYDREPFKASVEWLIEERKQFLARRPKNRAVKGVERPPKQARDRPVLVGDSESGEDDDILHSTTDEDADDDILHSSSSSEDAPLMNRARARPPQAGSSTGPGTKARQAVNKKSSVSQKATQPRPALLKPTAPVPSTSSARGSYPSPVVRTTKIGKEPATQPRKGGRVWPREDMQAGSISKDFRGIGTKGKQAERANEIVPLGRRSSTSTTPGAPATRTTNSYVNSYAGLTMRKAGQAAGSSAPGPSSATGGRTVASGALAGSPTELGPTERRASLDASLDQSIDAMIRGVEAEASPPNSLFDGSLSGEDEAPPQLADDLTFDDFMADLPPPVHQAQPQQPKSSRPERPTISIGAPPAQDPWDDFASNQANTSYEPAPNQVMESPVFTISPLQPGQWRWTGELYVVTQESVPMPDGGQTTKDAQNRVCAVVIRDPAVHNEKATKIFTSTLESYVKGKIDIQSAFDVNVAYAEIVAGAFEPTQAGWMMCTDQEETPEWELWKGVLRKMELLLLVSVVKIYNSKNVEFARHLLLIPSPLVRKFRRAPALNPMLEPFGHHTNGFVVLMCKKNYADSTPTSPRPLLAAQLPEHWQSIPPELRDELRGVRCLIFPGRHVDPEVNILRTELAACGAIPIDGVDQHGVADAVFVHRAWVEHLSTILGFTHRKQKLHKRFYAFGSGGLWRVAEWDVRQIWLFGGMVTFTPAAILEDPTIVCRVVQEMEGKVFWHAYIEPKTVGILALRKDNAALGFEIVTFLEEIAQASDFVPYGLALTSPAPRGLVESYEWADKQLHRASMTGDELRESCEEEATKAYRTIMEEKAKREEEEKARKEEEAAKLKAQEAAKVNGGGWGNGSTNGGGGWGNDSTGGGGWGDSASGGGGGWGNESGVQGAGAGWSSPTQAQPSNNPWGTTNDSAATDPRLRPKPKPEVDMSGLGNEKHIREMSREVINGLRQMQIQPCFMREVRRFVVIDAKTRVKDIKAEKLEVEVHTADDFIADLIANY